MGLTNYLKNNILNHVFRNVSYSSPSTVYVGLFDGTSEISGSGYARQAINFGTPTNGIISNQTEVQFPVAIGDWGDVTGGGIFDASSGGNRLDSSEVASVRVIKENDQFIIPVGNYVIEVN